MAMRFTDPNPQRKPSVFSAWHGLLYIEKPRDRHVLFDQDKQKSKVTLSWDDLSVFSAGATEEAAYKIYYPQDIWDWSAYKDADKNICPNSGSR